MTDREMYERYCECLDEDDIPLDFEDWLAWTLGEDALDYEDDYDLDVGFDPYCGCYTWDC